MGTKGGWQPPRWRSWRAYSRTGGVSSDRHISQLAYFPRRIRAASVRALSLRYNSHPWCRLHRSGSWERREGGSLRDGEAGGHILELVGYRVTAISLNSHISRAGSERLPSGL